MFEDDFFLTVIAHLESGTDDFEYAEFVYRKRADDDEQPGEWQLIDANVSFGPDDGYALNAWDVRALPLNTEFEVAIIGVDTGGNADPDPPIMIIVNGSTGKAKGKKEFSTDG